MSRVSFAMRKQYLHQQLNDLNNKAKEISRKFMELHKYAAAVARGKMTLMDLAGMPKGCELFANAFVIGYYAPKVGVMPKALERAATLWANDQGKTDPNIRGKEYMGFKNLIKDMHENPELYEANRIKEFGNDEQALNNAKMLDAYKEHLFQEAIKAEENEYRKAKEAEIKVTEDELQQEKLMNDSRLEAVKQELANVEKAEPEAIKRSMGQYA